eukprot:gene12807-8720_t
MLGRIGFTFNGYGLSTRSGRSRDTARRNGMKSCKKYVDTHKITSSLMGQLGPGRLPPRLKEKVVADKNPGRQCSLCLLSRGAQGCLSRRFVVSVFLSPCRNKYFFQHDIRNQSYSQSNMSIDNFPPFGCMNYSSVFFNKTLNPYQRNQDTNIRNQEKPTRSPADWSRRGLRIT